MSLNTAMMMSSPRSRALSTTPMTPDTVQPVRLSDLPVGETARFHQADVDSAMDRFLRAVGMTRTSELRLCKGGEPCIVQVRTTRIGLSRLIARRIFVVPTPKGV